MSATIITGGARGVGLATARRLGAEGHTLVLVDLDGASAAAAADGLVGEGYECSSDALDVTDPDECERVVARIAHRHGGIRALVNCANIAIYGPSETLPPSEWRRQVDVA